MMKNEKLLIRQLPEIKYINYQFGNYSSKINLNRLENILRAAENGFIQDQSEFFAEMEEKDAHIFSEMSKRKRAVLSLPWAILPSSSNKEDIDIAKWTKERFESIPEIEDHMMILLDAVGYGFSISEIEWGAVGGEYVIKNLHEVHQKNFTYDYENQKIKLNDGSLHGAELKQFGWIKHFVRSKSGYVARSGLYRVISYLYLLKNYTIGDFAEFLEVYGLPMRLGKYPLSATADERKKLLQAVVSLGHDAGGIIPETMQIDFLEASKASSIPFTNFIDYIDKQISCAILGSTLTSSTSGNGSYALGKIHNEVRIEIVKGDAKQLSSTINRDIIEPLVFLNYGGNVKPPTFIFDIKDIEDIDIYSKSLPPLVDLGLDIPISWVKDKLGIPKSDGLEILKKG